MLSSTICFHSDSGASTAGPRSMTPALFTSASSRPSSPTVRSTASPACGSSVMSDSRTSTLPPCSRMSEATASSRSFLRAATATAAPWAASAAAVAAPMPLEAPVTRATVPTSGWSFGIGERLGARVGTVTVTVLSRRLWLGRAGSAVAGDLVLDGVQRRLQVAELGTDSGMVRLQEGQALVFGPGTAGDQGEVALDLPDRHRRGPQTADENHPVDVVPGEAPMPAGLATHLEGPDALVVAQSVGAHPRLLRHLGDREGLLLDGDRAHSHHAKAWSTL